jgi:hypothetical protein
MSLTISNTILDEEFRATQTGTGDDNDVASSSFISAAVTDLSLTTLTGYTGFPQYAEKTNFVSSSNTVTDYYLTVASGGVATTLYVGANQIFLYATSDPDIVVGRIGTGTTANPGGSVALIIGVDDSSLASPNLWLAQYAPFVESGLNLVDSADKLDLTGLVSLGSTYATSTQVPFENFEGLPSGNNLFNVIWPSDSSTAVELLVTGTKNGALSTVNVSTTGIGAGSQAIDVGATLRIDAVQGMDRTTVNEPNEVNQASNIAYHDLASDPDSDARVELTGADFEVTQVNPGNPNERVDIRVSAFNVAGADQGQTYLNNIDSNGTAVQIDAADVIVKNGAGQDITASLTITQDGDSVIIRGLDDGATNDKTDGYQVFFTTDGVGFDRMLVTNVDSKETLDIGNIHVTITVGGSANESADLGAHLIFEDDGPKITASTNTVSALIADDTTLGTDPTGSFAGLFNAPDYGADVPGSSTLQYSLGISGTGASTGLTETASGDAVFLFLESGKVVGRSGDTALLAASGPEVFEISVDSNGTVKLDQKSAVVQGNTSSYDESTSSMTATLITLTASVTDSEAANHNDSASASVNIGDLFSFKDDGPALTPQPGGSLTPNNLELPNALNASDSSSYGLLPGADGQKSYTIVGPEDTSGTYRWTYDNASHTSITGTYRDALNVDHSLYTLVLNPSTGAYTFTLTSKLPSSTESLGSTIIHAGGPTDTVDVQAASSTDFGRIVADSTVGAGLVNASHGFVGVDNGNLDSGESLNLSLHEANGDLIDVSGINIGTKSAGTSHYDYFVHMSDGSDIQVGDDVAVGKNGTITILDPNANDDVLIESITVFKVDGNAIKIGLGDIQFLIPPDDVQLGFSVELKDGDNDTTTQNFTVDIDGNNDGIYSASVNSLSVINPDPLNLLSTYVVHENLFAL